MNLASNSPYSRMSQTTEIDVLKAKITELQAEVEALRKDVSWQPIETAPKDDDSLILVANDEGAWVAKYRPVYQSGFKPSNPWSSMLLNHDHIRLHMSHAPTHWMPLPKPPTAIAKDTQEQ